MIRKVFDKTALRMAEAPNHAGTMRLYRGLLRQWRDKAWNDWDNVICVTGGEGTGKSSFSLNLMHDMDDDDLKNFRNHVVWRGGDLSKLIFGSERKVLIHDEAGLDFFSRSSMERVQVELVKAVQIMREYNHMPILNLPSHDWLDTYLKNHRVKWLVKVWTVPKKVYIDGIPLTRDERGFATFHRNIKTQWSRKSWFEELFTMRFPDYPPSIADAYRKEKRRNSLERMMGAPVDERTEYILRAEKIGVKRKVVAQIFGLTEARICQILKVGEQTLKDAGVEMKL